MNNRLTAWISQFFWPRPELRIQAGQSAVVIGRLGSGKTTFIKWLLQNQPSVIVYDSKWESCEWDKDSENYVITDNPAHLPAHPRVVLQCDSMWLNDHTGWDNELHPWSIALEHPMIRRGTIAFFDEASNTWLTHGGHHGTHRLIQQGRSKEVTTFIGSQLANNIDTRILRLASHVFVMGPTPHETELEHIAKAVRVDTTPLLKLRRRQIAWWNEESREWTVFRQVNLSKQGIIKRKSTSVEFLNNRRIRRLLLFGLIALLNLISIWPALIALIFTIYVMARYHRSLYWNIFCESRPWEPQEIYDEKILNIRKEPPKKAAKTINFGP